MKATELVELLGLMVLTAILFVVTNKKDYVNLK
jgi:hypothetical protein